MTVLYQAVHMFRVEAGLFDLETFLFHEGFKACQLS